MKQSLLIALGLVGTQAVKLQSKGPYGNAGPEGKGPTYPSPQPFIRGEKQWIPNAQNIGDWGENQMEVANARIPYASTLLQTEGPAPFGLAPDAKGKPIPGAPAVPSPQPFTRGEKQWMTNAQNIGNWGENQMVVANARIPYASTLTQLEETGPAPFGLAPGENGPVPGAPAWPSPQPFVRGEKQWMDNAQNIGDWGENQMIVANTRIPYASTLTQLEEQGPAPFGLARGEGDALKGAPAWPSPQPFIRGEKQWMTNAQNIGDWGENQMIVANTRIPYASTLIQINDSPLDHDEGETPFEKETDMSILYEKSDGSKGIPDNQDPAKMDNFAMADLTNMPLNFRI